MFDVPRIKSRLGQRGSSYIKPSGSEDVCEVVNSNKRPLFAHGTSKDYTGSTLMFKEKHGGVNKCLFGSGGLQEPSLLDKTPMFTNQSLAVETQMDGPRRSILGRKSVHPSRSTIDRSYTTADSIQSTKEDVPEINTPFALFTEQHKRDTDYFRKTDEGAWSVFKTKPSAHTTQPKNPSQLPLKNVCRPVVPNKSFIMNRYLQFRTGVLKSPETPPTSIFCNRKFDLLPEPVPPSPAKSLKDSMNRDAKGQTDCSKIVCNDSESGSISSYEDESSLKSFTDNEHTIMALEKQQEDNGSDDTVLLPSSVKRDGEVSPGITRFDCDRRDDSPNKVHLSDTQDRNTGGNSNFDTSILCNEGVSLASFLAQLIEQKAKSDRMLEVYLKERQIFDSQLKTILDAVGKHHCTPSGKKAQKVISTKLKRSTYNSPADKLSQSRFEGSAAKAYSELRASYKTLLKTPKHKTLQSNPRDKCYTPQSLSTRIDQQMEHIFES